MHIAAAAARVTVSLLLEEAAPALSPVMSPALSPAANANANANATPARTVAKAWLTRTPQLRAASFELPIPPHLPASSTLHAADVAVQLRWVALFTFELEGGGWEAQVVPWRLPLRVVPRARMRATHAREHRLPAPGLPARERAVALRREGG